MLWELQRWERVCGPPFACPVFCEACTAPAQDGTGGGSGQTRHTRHSATCPHLTETGFHHVNMDVSDSAIPAEGKGQLQLGRDSHLKVGLYELQWDSCFW